MKGIILTITKGEKKDGWNKKKHQKTWVAHYSLEEFEKREIVDLLKEQNKKEGNLMDMKKEWKDGWYICVRMIEWSVSAWDSETNLNIRKPTLASAKIQPNIGNWQTHILSLASYALPTFCFL